MGLQSTTTGTLSDELRLKAENAIDQLKPHQYSDFIQLLHDERHFSRSEREWQPYEEILLSAGVNRSSPQERWQLLLSTLVRQAQVTRKEIEASKQRIGPGRWGV